MNNYFKFFLILIININCSSINFSYTHPLEIKFDSTNLDFSKKDHRVLLSYLEEESRILSSMVNSIGKKYVKINSKIIIEKCEKNLRTSKEEKYSADIVIIPFIEKFKERNFKAIICDDKSRIQPSIALFQINTKFNINDYMKTSNDKYLFRLEILVNLMNCLGLTNTFMTNLRKPKNNYFQTPDYLLNNSVSYKSIKKLYKLSGKEVPQKDIHLNGDFYRPYWDNDLIIKDFRNSKINIENDMSETSFNLLNDIDYYSVSKCDLEYDDYGVCHRVDQKCINSEQFDNEYYLRYGINNLKIICYFSDKNNIANNQCGNRYGPLMSETINFSPLIRKNEIEKIKNGDYEIPELKDYNEQELYLLVPSEKCKNKFPRTLFFLKDENETIQNKEKLLNITLNDIILNETQRKFFVSFQIYEEKYIRFELLFILYLNELIRSYVQLGNHNLFIASFPQYLLKERGKENHKINKYQKVFNHVGSEVFAKKDMLYTKYKSQKNLFPNDYNYMQETYLYPEDKKIILKKFQNYKVDKNNLWLIKPKFGNTGSGIHIFKSLKNESNEFLITKYITNPHLINGKKYDLRIYVLVTGLKPLRIYLNKEGLVRISAEKFNLNENNLENSFIHLTNTGINKKSKEYVYAKDFFSENANKLSFHTYQKYLEREKADYISLRKKISDIVIKTVISGYQFLVDNLNEFNLNDTSFFNLYGYDILVNDKYEPYLLEVNRRPDMHIFDEMDKVVKENIFVDTLNIVGIVPFSHDEKVETLDEVYKYNSKIDENVDYAYCELTRPRGSFDLIFPLKDNIDKYKKFFRINLLENEKFWKKIKNSE